MAGPAALALVTPAPKVGRPAPYEDEFDEAAGRFTYPLRAPQGSSPAAARQAEADNPGAARRPRIERSNHPLRRDRTGQYAIVAPAFVMSLHRVRRLLELEARLPVADMTD